MSSEGKSSEGGASAPTSKVDVKLQGKSVVRVYMLDNSTKTLILEPTTTAKEVSQTLAEKIGLRDSKSSAQFFALFESKNGVTVNRPLADDESVLEVVSSWEPGSKSLLVYQVKLFMNTNMNSDDPKMMYMLYVQAVHHTITGIYPVDALKATKLAAYQVLARFGPHDPATHQVGLLTKRLREFVPAPLMASSKKSAEQWEADIYREHEVASRSVSAGDPNAIAEYAHREYLNLIKEEDFYGCTFFVAKQKDFAKLPKTILLGINARGIQIMKVGRKSPYLQFKLSEIYRWGFKPTINFYFEVKHVTGSGPVYEFDTNEGGLISELLTDYAMALLRELGITTGDEEAEGAGAGGEMNDETAAVKIQAAFRGHQLRRDLEREYAAIRVQAVWRGHAERLKFDKMLTEMEQELE
mmetsp:Transcript_21795/g.70167  ORF Transcript_21795/g.70167 Transcript_21795/m.70167 type:complete len:412 (-) Transcript_21795:62-1297(-)